jgi:chromosome segregation ATPase
MMTPVESQETTLTLSRERLARAISKFERLARDAGETITALRQEKQGLDRRLADLTKLVEQERSNFKQKTALLTSFNLETEERAKTAEDLNRRLTEQEGLMTEQLETITRLESQLEQSSREFSKRDVLEAAGNQEMEEWRAKVSQLEGRLANTQSERDSMKSELYEHERQEAHFALRLTPEDRDKAAKAIDTLLDQLTVMETRIAPLSPAPFKGEPAQPREPMQEPIGGSCVRDSALST